MLSTIPSDEVFGAGSAATRINALEARCRTLDRLLATANRDMKYGKLEIARVVNEASHEKKQHRLEMNMQKEYLARQYGKQYQRLTGGHEEEINKLKETVRTTRRLEE